MSIHLNTETVTLYGNCDKCGGVLYDILIETGEGVCEKCERTESFDPKTFER